LVEINNYEPKIIILPQVKDEEYNPWRMNVYDSAKNKLPSFIEVQEGILRISPTSK
jgi:hypothetical protein